VAAHGLSLGPQQQQQQALAAQSHSAAGWGGGAAGWGGGAAGGHGASSVYGAAAPAYGPAPHQQALLPAAYTPPFSPTFFVRSPAQAAALAAAAGRATDARLSAMLRQGVGYHSAGEAAADRGLVEALFTSGHLPVLCTTSTLSVGVNLPAYLVVIKSTQQYRGAGHGYCEMPKSTLLQMCGRAGRPQFETSGAAVIMTQRSTAHLYAGVAAGGTLDPVESTLHGSLVEHVASEACMGTVPSVRASLAWLRSTFLYIRMRASPQTYGLPAGAAPAAVDGQMRRYLLSQLFALAQAGCVRFEAGEETVRRVGRAAAAGGVTGGVGGAAGGAAAGAAAGGAVAALGGAGAAAGSTAAAAVHQRQAQIAVSGRRTGPSADSAAATASGSGSGAGLSLTLRAGVVEEGREGEEEPWEGPLVPFTPASRDALAAAGDGVAITALGPCFVLSQHYLRFATFALFPTLPRTAGVVELLQALAGGAEFTGPMVLRREERKVCGRVRVCGRACFIRACWPVV
jgi:hypothetical protein